MGHSTVTTNTTDMHSQTEVKCKVPHIANSNMHSKINLLKVDNTSKKNQNDNINKQRILQTKLHAAIEFVKQLFRE